MQQVRLLRYSVIGFSAILAVVILVVAFLHYDYLYNRDKDIASRRAEQSVNIASNHISLTLTTVDGMLSRAIEKYYVHALLKQDVVSLIKSHLNDRIYELPLIAAVAVVDDQREVDWIATNEPYNGQNIHAIYKQYNGFLAQQDEIEKGGLAINIIGYDISQQYLVLTRPLLDSEHHIHGMISAFVDVSYLKTYFNSIRGDKQADVALLLDEGSFISTTKELPVGVVNMLYDAFMVDTVGPQRPFVVEVDVQDAGHKIVAYEHLANLPLTVAMVIDGNEVLHSATVQRNYYIVFLSVFLLFAAVVYGALWLISKHMQRVKHSEEMAVMANQAKSEFLARMSHEFRTPLNAIIGFSEVLKEGLYGKLSRKQKDRINDINDCGMHLLNIVNDILEFSKGEANKLSLYEGHIAVRACILRAVSMIKPEASKKEIRLIEKIDQRLPRFRADEKKITQVLVNLLSNAVKFTPEKGVIIVSATLSKSKDLVIQVKDTGIGMSEQDLPHAMSIFGQVVKKDYMIGTSTEGTGLGLPLCKMFIELHDGTIDIESMEGMGTTVTVILPVERMIKVKRRNTARANVQTA